LSIADVSAWAGHSATIGAAHDRQPRDAVDGVTREHVHGSGGLANHGVVWVPVDKQQTPAEAGAMNPTGCSKDEPEGECRALSTVAAIARLHREAISEGRGRCMDRRRAAA
jgi:hypothetical protein